ncbi:MAG: hypothetical protein ABWY82_21285, partial [Tardiphaga sp.]
LPAKPLALANACAGAGKAALIAGHVALLAKWIGMADVVAAVSNAEGMQGSRKAGNGRAGYGAGRAD